MSVLKKEAEGGICRVMLLAKESCGYYLKFLKGVLRSRLTLDIGSNRGNGAGSKYLRQNCRHGSHRHAG